VTRLGGVLTKRKNCFKTHDDKGLLHPNETQDTETRLRFSTLLADSKKRLQGVELVFVYTAESSAAGKYIKKLRLFPGRNGSQICAREGRNLEPYLRKGVLRFISQPGDRFSREFCVPQFLQANAATYPHARLQQLSHVISNSLIIVPFTALYSEPFELILNKT
jgi:hypothetical protein